jgi:hypothetical protein
MNEMPTWAVIIIAIVSGAISSLVAPWAKWGIEKRRALIDYRKKRIAEWRRLIQAASSIEDIRSSVLPELRDHMSKQDLDSFSGAWVTIAPRGADPEKGKLVRVSSIVTEVEKKWGLI